MNENKFWKSLNSPIVVLLIGLIILPFVLTISQVYSAKLKTRIMANEIRSWATDIKDSKDQGTIKLLVSNAIGQVAEGIKAGFKQTSQDQDKQLSEFQSLRAGIEISEIKSVPTPWQTQEKTIGVVTNKTDRSIRNIHLNVLFYGLKGELIDVKDEWLAGLKVLDPKQNYGFEVTRNLGDNNADAKLLSTRRSSSVKIQIVSFDVLNPTLQ